MFELGREDYAEAQLFSNLLERTTSKYWPYLVGLVLTLLIGLYALLPLLFGWWSASRPADLKPIRAPLREGRLPSHPWNSETCHELDHHHPYRPGCSGDPYLPIYLPAFLRLLGIHRHYTIPDFDMKGRRALMICTNHDRMDPKKKPTGAFGSEFTVPYYAFINAGMEVDMASPKGGVIPIQPWSWSWPLACHDDKRRFMADKKGDARSQELQSHRRSGPERLRRDLHGRRLGRSL